MHRSALVLTVLASTLVACSSDNGISTGNGGSTIPTAGTGGAMGQGGATSPTDTPDGAAIPGTGGSTTPPVVGTGGSPVIGNGGATTGAGGGAGGAIVINLDAALAGMMSTPDAAVLPDSGSAGTVGCNQDLSGTWDLFATSVGTGIVRGTLTVKKEGFSLSTKSALLAYDATAPSATWKYAPPYYYDPSPTTRLIAIKSTPAAANTGSFPIAIGGRWELQSGTETCTLDVAADKITGKCAGRAGDHNVGGEDWPYELMPSPENRLTYTIARSGALASQFGDFGGTWSAKSDSGSGQGCTIKLEGSTATTSCRASNSFNGNLQLTVGPDCVASGVTPSGLEVSARRR